MAAGLLAAVGIVHLGVLELRLRYSSSPSALQEIRQFEIVGRHAKKLAAVAAVPLAIGMVLLMLDQEWGVVPMLLGQAVGWITLTHWLGSKRIARRRRSAESFRPRSLMKDLALISASVVIAGVVMYLRTGEVRTLLWLLPLSIFAVMGLVVMRVLGSAPDRRG